MDLAQVGIIALVVITITEALKELFPRLTGNLTRLIALFLGAFLGYLAQVGVLPIPDTNLVSGAISGVVAVGGHILASKMGGD